MFSLAKALALALVVASTAHTAPTPPAHESDHDLPGSLNPRQENVAVQYGCGEVNVLLMYVCRASSAGVDANICTAGCHHSTLSWQNRASTPQRWMRLYAQIMRESSQLDKTCAVGLSTYYQAFPD